MGTSDKSKSTELNKLYIETLQPITHYDENAKSVVFVQGRIGRGGEKISSKEVRGYFTPDLVMSPFGLMFLRKSIQMKKHLSR